MQEKVRPAPLGRHLSVVRKQDALSDDWRLTLAESGISNADLWAPFMDFVLDVSRIAAWEVDPVTGLVRRSPGHDRIFGYDCPLPRWTHETFLLHVLPEDRDLMEETLRAGLAGHGESGAECRIRRADGEIRWVWTVGKRRPGPDGEWRMAGIIQDITDRKEADRRLEESLLRAWESESATIKVLSSVTELRDPYTAGHQKRVAEICVAIADFLGMRPVQRHGLEIAALLHDVGKVSVPIEILACPGHLSSVQSRLVEGHVEAGYEILRDMTGPSPVAQIVRQHHERLDGSGYPAGLKGDEILFEARILAVADTAEAMSSHRPYRPAPGKEAAKRELQINRSILYDPVVVDAFLAITSEG